MFPNISSNQKNVKRTTTHNTNKFKYVNYYVNTNTKWQDQYPPENIEQIYESCQTRLDEISSKLESLKEKYKIGDNCIIGTLSAYSRHLSRLKTTVGLDEVKSAKTMAEVIKIVRNNIEYTRREQRRRAASEAAEKQDDDQMGVDDQLKMDTASADEEFIKTEKSMLVEDSKLDEDVFSEEDEKVENSEKQQKPRTPRFDYTNAMNYIQHRRDRNVAPFAELKKIDPVITPILAKTKKDRVIVNQETEEDLTYLETLLQTSLKAIDEYAIETENIKSLCVIFEKYFHTFFYFVESYIDEEPQTNIPSTYKNIGEVRYEKLLETVLKYNEKREEYIEFVENCLRNLERLTNAFTEPTSHEGIAMQRHMSDDSRALARRCDCDFIQAALVIPEHNSQLTKCVAYLRQWLEYDRSYPDFIREDLKEIEREKKRLVQMRISGESAFNQLTHRIKLFKESLLVQINDLKDTLKKAGSKLLYDFDEFDGSFITNNRRWSTSTTRASFNQLKELIDLSSYSQLDCAKMLDRVGLDLNELDTELVRQNRIVVNSRTKLDVVEEKFQALVNMKQTIAKLGLQLYSLYNEKCIKQSEIDVWENSYARLKEIYMCKVNSDTVEKIYYNIKISSSRRNTKTETDVNMPYSVFSNFSDSKRTDTLNNIILIVANSIGTDWIRLYYSLPFYPARGKETIKKDIDDVLSDLNRGNMEREQCFVSLQKWRRFNSRARLDDLRGSLESIGRGDIVKEIDKSLSRENDLKMTSKEAKKASVQEVDAKKREIEILHQRLVKYLEKNKNEENAIEFDFKFADNQQL